MHLGFESAFATAVALHLTGPWSEKGGPEDTPPVRVGSGLECLSKWWR